MVEPNRVIRLCDGIKIDIASDGIAAVIAWCSQNSGHGWNVVSDRGVYVVFAHRADAVFFALSECREFFIDAELSRQV